MSNELAQDEALMNEFLTESNELLQQMDEDLVALESSPDDPESLNRVFREIHTIKGTSSFLGFDSLVAVSHAAEDFLNRLRKREVALTRRGMDALLAARDSLQVMLEDLSAKRECVRDTQALLAELQTVREENPTARLGEIMVSQNVVSAPQVEQALAEARTTGDKLGETLVQQGVASRAQVKEALAHQAAAAVSNNVQITSMRVDAGKLDELVNLVGELVLERNRLAQISRDVSAGKLANEELCSALSQSTSRLNFVTDEIQSTSLRTRMVPIETLFRRFPRMVRDVANALGKSVRLEIQGEDTELDRTMVEQITDPLVHLVRNSLDHGIESPESRAVSGKGTVGCVRLQAKQQSDQIVISISDDGAGIDTERVARKAVEKGILTQERAQLLTRREQLELIFAPGLSTAEKVSSISGRGVGMDVVRSNITRINGTVEIDSLPGRGTTILLRVPLPLAILPVLLVESSDETYGIPLRSVLKTLRVEQKQIHLVEGQEVLQLSDETLPLIRLQSTFAQETTTDAPLMRVVILHVGDRKLGVLVNRLLGQESTVVKPLSARVAHSPCIAGATISGDGRVRLVLDPAGLLKASAHAAVENVESA